MEESRPENLQLYVVNTFLHVKDEDFETQKAQSLKRSSSDSSLGSTSPALPKPISVSRTSKSSSGEERLAHIVWPTPADSSTSPSDSVSSSDGCTGSHARSRDSPKDSPRSGCVKVGVVEPRQVAAGDRLNSVRVSPGQVAPNDSNFQHGVALRPGHISAQNTSQHLRQGEPEQRSFAEQSQMSDASRHALHEAGKCRPCILWVPQQCKLGDGCPYCHLPHCRTGKRNRPSKKTRDQRLAVIKAQGSRDGSKDGPAEAHS